MIHFLILTILTASAAQLSEQQVLEHVLQQFPAVQIAQKDVSIAEGEETSARGSFDLLLQGSLTQNTGDYENENWNAKIVKPTSLFGLDLYAGYRKSDGLFPVYDEDLKTMSKGEWSVGLKLPLLRDFLIDDRRARLKKANLNVDARRSQLRSAEIDYIRMALHRYWDWVLAAKKVLIQKELLSTAEKRDLWLHRRMKAGDVARFERDDNRRTILARTSFVLQSELALEQTKAELIYYLEGSSFIPLLSNPRAIPDNSNNLEVHPYRQIPLEKLVDLALQQRPELQNLSLQIEQNKIDESLQNNRFLPKLDVQAQYSKDEGLGSTSLDDHNVKAMVNLEIPLQYRSIRGRQAQVHNITEKLNQQKRLLQQRITADLKIIKKNFEVAIQRQNLAHEELLLAQSLEAGERTRLSHGETNILTVNLREQATAEAQLRLAETTIEAIKHLISLKAGVGEIPSLK